MSLQYCGTVRAAEASAAGRCDDPGYFMTLFGFVLEMIARY